MLGETSENPTQRTDHEPRPTVCPCSDTADRSSPGQWGGPATRREDRGHQTRAWWPGGIGRQGWRCSEWEHRDGRVTHVLGQWGGMLRMQVEEFDPNDRGRGGMGRAGLLREGFFWDGSFQR